MNESLMVSSALSSYNLQWIIDNLQSSYWAKHLDENQIWKAFYNSYCFILLLNNKPIGFARVVSDCQIFAYLMDVMIRKDCRMKGFGKYLIHHILEKSVLNEVENWSLTTKDAQNFYNKFGFQVVKKTGRYMKMNKTTIH